MTAAVFSLRSAKSLSSCLFFWPQSLSLFCLSPHQIYSSMDHTPKCVLGLNVAAECSSASSPGALDASLDQV